MRKGVVILREMALVKGSAISEAQKKIMISELQLELDEALGQKTLPGIPPIESAKEAPKEAKKG